MAVVLITGCRRPSGFGYLSAISVAEAGHVVYATMRDAAQGQELRERAESQGLDVRILAHDMTSTESNRRVVATIIQETGRLDVLVNNAGVGAFGAVETMKEETLRKVMETNFFGGVDLCRAVLPVMREQGGGRVIFVTSVAGRLGVPGEGAYSASKFATEGLAEVLAYEVRRWGIDVSIIEPGFFNTGMSAENTSAEEQYVQHDDYDAFNAHIVASTEEGENSGEDPQLVADMILEAATTPEPKLRWLPGRAAPVILGDFQASTDEEWQARMVDAMGLRWWIDGEANKYLPE